MMSRRTHGSEMRRKKVGAKRRRTSVNEEEKDDLYL